METPSHLSSTFAAEQEVALGELVVWATGFDGNLLSGSDLAKIPGSEIGWAWHDRHPDADMNEPYEPDYHGWFAVAPNFTVAEYLPNNRGAYPLCLHIWITGAGPEALEGWGETDHPDDTLPPPSN